MVQTWLRLWTHFGLYETIFGCGRKMKKGLHVFVVIGLACQGDEQLAVVIYRGCPGVSAEELQVLGTTGGYLPQNLPSNRVDLPQYFMPTCSAISTLYE